MKVRDKNEVFIFDDSELKRLVQYELKLLYRMGNSFNFVHDKLVMLKHHASVTDFTGFRLESITKKEGKNYNWLAITSGDVKLIIRQYGTHMTIFTYKGKGEDDYRRSYGAFTFHTNTKLMDDNDSDQYYDTPFTDLNAALPQLVKIVSEDKMHSLWNNLSFKRPDRCEVELAFMREEISSFDSLIFCSEELSSQHVELFAENDMLDKLKTMGDRIGESFDWQYTIRNIKTEFPKNYSTPYYHGVGIGITDKKTGDEKFQDVYSLTRWYMDSVFPQEKT